MNTLNSIYINNDNYCSICSSYGSYIESYDTYACYNCLSWLGNNIYKQLPAKPKKSDFENITYAWNTSSTSNNIIISNTASCSSSIISINSSSVISINSENSKKIEDFFKAIGIEIETTWYGGKYSIDAEKLMEILEDEEKLKALVSKIKNKAFW